MKLRVVAKGFCKHLNESLDTVLSTKYLGQTFDGVSRDNFNEETKKLVGGVNRISMHSAIPIDADELLQRYPNPPEGQIDLIMIDEYLATVYRICNGGPRSIELCDGLSDERKAVVSLKKSDATLDKLIAHELTHSLGVINHCGYRCLMGDASAFDLCDEHEREFYRIHPKFKLVA